MSIGRREFLKSSAALAAVSAAGGFSCIEIAAAAPIEVPTIDGLSIRVDLAPSVEQPTDPVVDEVAAEHQHGGRHQDGETALSLVHDLAGRARFHIRVQHRCHASVSSDLGLLPS